MRRVALPCGILGGVWGILAPIVVPVVILLTDEEELSLLKGIPGAFLVWLGFIVLMGALGILAIILNKRSHKLGKPLLWASAVAILLVSFVDIAIGLFFLPASVLLLMAAIGLKKEEVRRLK
ncbi:MAG: hypothetical protein ACE5KP_05485 [Dehalococcoidales bacterium]